ncbi:MAG: tRNA guanosine(34) transglycosylase Tgt [Rickettsiales bacterium]|nr:tRNA guanosine(34) transglycosylase Tgt [Rickettsiales bacterium]
MFEFEISARSKEPGVSGRVGSLTTPHGKIETPIFMPVGTRAALRAMTPDQVQATGAQIVLANTYHLALQPGAAIIERLGGLHNFMSMPLPILTDSGGFQVFSLPKKQITEKGVTFSWRKGGEPFLMTPERAIQIQEQLGADIIMAFDECVPYPCPRDYAEQSVARTTRWEQRCLAARRRTEDQALFGIVQGSTYEDLRRRSCEDLVPLDFPGYAIGGLSVGEGLEVMNQVLGWTTPFLPPDKPRYLMGVGLPEDLWCGVGHGVDMFDCVIPTRHARGALLYTFQGKMRVSNKRYRKDRLPPDTSCPCYTCRNFSRAYLHHMFAAEEVTGTTLACIHNISFLQQLMNQIRKSIEEGRFLEAKAEFFARYGSSYGPPARN